MSVNQTAVIIVGAGPSGLATAACFHQLSIPYLIIEREDCFASLWKKSSYDRLHLHLPKQFCQLPHMDFPANYPTYVSKHDFLLYLDNYVAQFEINPIYRSSVEMAKYDENRKKWMVKAKRTITDGDGEGDFGYYEGRFLVVATGETSDAFIPEVEGLSKFDGEIMHSTQYKNGGKFEKKNVLVVGSGNSGMEIALDLCEHGANTSIVVRSPRHILSKKMVYMALVLLKYLPLNTVDSMMALLSKLIYGDLTMYGIERPKDGPFYSKVTYGKYPIVDVGTYAKIKSREIQVLPALKSAREGSQVEFENGKCLSFDAIVFATGFKRSTHLWLQGDDYLLNEDGLPKRMFPNHWKGENGLYCVGLARRGFPGAAIDAQNIANHIFKQL